MWTLSGFSDEISPDLEEQCALVRKLGMTHLEFRSAWGTNVLDLDSTQLAKAKATSTLTVCRSPASARRSAEISIDEDFDTHLDRDRHAVDIAHHFGALYIQILPSSSPTTTRPRRSPPTRCCAA